MTLPLPHWWFRDRLSDDSGHRATVSRSAAHPASSSHAEERADEPLVARIRAGDAAAFEQIVKVQYASLCTFAVRFTRSAALAEEVVQDVLLSVWEHRETWRVTAGARAYLFGAVRHRALNVLARSKLESRISDQVTAAGDIPGLALASPPPDFLAAAADIRAHVRHAVDALPEGRRSVFVLRWDHGLSVAEIAAATGSTPVAVERQLNRALHTLRASLEHLFR